MRRWPFALWLAALWVLLWRDPSIANILSGLALGTGLARWRARPGTSHRTHTVRTLALLRFLVYFHLKVLQANLVLAREIVTPRNSIQTGILEVELPGCSRLTATIVANCVGLTPGTLTLEVRDGDPVALYVHVLHLHDVQRARDEVRRMAEHVTAAFPIRATPTAPRGEEVPA
jgi:multicomponent Na+:H+ antiporter subunit E